MTDLVAFLLQRVADDERIAQDADPGVWTFSADVEFSGGSGNITSETSGERFNIAYDYDREAGYGAVDANNAPHIVAWSPARVLAECRSKRAIIECARDLVTDPYAGTLILRHLAIPYSGHPDFDPAWETP